MTVGHHGCIVTLTPNPSIDRTLVLGQPLRRGAVHRIEASGSQAGGKGVNISRACLSADVGTLAVLPADPEDPFVHELTASGIPSRLTPCDGPVRVNLTITEPDGTTTKLNSPGSLASGEVLASLADTLHALADEADWIVLAGSLPPGAPQAWYAELVGDLRARTRVAVDTSAAPLLAVVEHLDTAPPHVMKPNGHELATLTGGDGDQLEADPVAAAQAARTLVERGVGAVLATLGGHGAVLVTGDGAWHARPAPSRWSAPWGPATPASSATCWETCADWLRPSASPSRSPTAPRPPGSPAPPSPSLRTCDPTWSTCARSPCTTPRGRATDEPVDHHRPGPPRRRPGRR